MLDLDAARKALGEVGKERTVKFKGKRWKLPPELPFSVLLELEDGKGTNGTVSVPAVRGILRHLLNGQYEAFMAKDPSQSDISYFLDSVLVGEYGVGLGESVASAAS